MTTQENVNLTAEELQMIQEKRAQEQQARKEKAEREKEIAMKEMKRIATRHAQQNAAATAFYEGGFEGNPDWKLVEETCRQTYNHADPDTGKDISHTLELSTMRIVYQPNPVIFVTVEEHIVYDGYAYRGQNKGWTMFIQGLGWNQERRPLKNPKTIIKKVNAYFENIRAEENKKNREKNAVQNFAKSLKNKYPDATVKIDQKWVYTDHHRREGEVQPRVYITLKNGVEFEYQVFPDGSYVQCKMHFPKTDKARLLELINSLDLSEKHSDEA